MTALDLVDNLPPNFNLMPEDVLGHITNKRMLLFGRESILSEYVERVCGSKLLASLDVESAFSVSADTIKRHRPDFAVDLRYAVGMEYGVLNEKAKNECVRYLEFVDAQLQKLGNCLPYIVILPVYLMGVVEESYKAAIHLLFVEGIISDKTDLSWNNFHAYLYWDNPRFIVSFLFKTISQLNTGSQHYYAKSQDAISSKELKEAICLLRNSQVGRAGFEIEDARDEFYKTGNTIHPIQEYDTDPTSYQNLVQIKNGRSLSAESN